MYMFYEGTGLACGEVYSVSITNLGVTVQVDIENILKLPEQTYQNQVMDLYRLVKNAKDYGLEGREK